MALSTTISALTREKFIPVLVDNIFTSNALNLKLLKNAEKLDGGVKINVPVEMAQNANKGWITPVAPSKGVVRFSYFNPNRSNPFV